MSTVSKYEWNMYQTQQKYNRLMKQFLASHPLCEECMKNGRYMKATDVEHIVVNRKDENTFWNWDNWRALCHDCYSKRTMKKDKGIMNAKE